MPMQTAPTSTPDPLLETQVFWGKYKTQIVVAIVAAILVIAAVSAFRYMAARKSAAAAELLANAKGIEEYQKVIAQYPSSGAAASASLLLAAQQREKQQFAEANTSLQGFIDKNPKHELVTTAKMAMAGNLESLGKADEALEMYRRIAADYPTSYNAPFALLAQVPLLKAKGQIDEARRVCETVLTQFRDTYAASVATQTLRTLKSPAAAAAPVPAAPAGAAAPGVMPTVPASPAPSASATP